MAKFKLLNKWILGAIIGVMTVLIFPFLSYLSTDNIVNLAPDDLILASLLFICLYLIKPIIMVLPISVLYLAAGIIFPTGWAILLTYLCLTLSLSIGYFLGRRLGNERATQMLERHERIKQFFETRSENLPMLCLVSRVLRMQFDVVNMISGAIKIPYKHFLFASLVGVTPIVIPYIIAADSILDPLSPGFLIPLIFSLSLSLLILGPAKKFYNVKHKVGMPKNSVK